MIEEVLSQELLLKLHFRRFKHRELTQKQIELMRVYVWTMATILQKGNGITKAVAGRLEDMPDDFVIMESDLTPVGRKFELTYLVQWLYHRQLHREQGTPEDFARASNKSVLERQLKHLKSRLEFSAQNNIDLIRINTVRYYGDILLNTVNYLQKSSRACLLCKGRIFPPHVPGFGIDIKRL